MAAVASCSFKGHGKCKAAPLGEDELNEAVWAWSMIPCGTWPVTDKINESRATSAPSMTE